MKSTHTTRALRHASLMLAVCMSLASLAHGQSITKVRELTSATAINSSTIFYGVLDPSGTPLDRKITSVVIGDYLASETRALTNKTYNGLTVTTTTGTFTLANGKTATVSNTLTFAGTDGSTLNIGAGGTLGTAAFTAATAYVQTSSLGSGVATWLATPSSANLAAAVTDETGSGALVFANSPSLTTPNLGTPSAVTLTNGTGLPISTGVSGLGAGVATFLATPSSANLLAAATDETGSGALVFANSPVLTTPNLGTPSAVTLTNGTGLPAAGVVGTAAVLGANTFTRLQTITQSTANEGIVASTGYSLTGSSAVSLVDWAGTWNTTGVPIAIKLNITDTASDGSSLFMDLRKDNASVFRVGKTGSVTTAGNIEGGGGIISSSAGGFFKVNSRFSIEPGGADKIVFYNAAGTDAASLHLGGTSSSHPAMSRVGAFTRFTAGDLSTGGGVELLAIAAAPTPSTDSALVYSKLVSSTAEVFVRDEAGNETQISPHNHTAPASFVDSEFDEIGYSANYYTGLVYYVNQQRKAAGRADYLLIETFTEHNTRRSLMGGDALVQLDWATVQAVHVAKREAERTAWLARKTAWELEHAEPFEEPQPPVYVAKAVPAWLTAQLTERAAYLAARDVMAGEATARLAKRTAVGGSVATLRQWSTDAATTHTNWPTMTAGQKDSTQREVIRRLGIFFERFADLIEAQSLDQ